MKKQQLEAVKQHLEPEAVESIEVTPAEKEVLFRGVELFEKDVMRAAQAAQKLGTRGKDLTNTIMAIADVELNELKSKLL